MWPNPQETADLVTLTEENLNGKLYFLRSTKFFLVAWLLKLFLGIMQIIFIGKFAELYFNFDQHLHKLIDFGTHLFHFHCILEYLRWQRNYWLETIFICFFNPLTTNVLLHIDISQLICNANQFGWFLFHGKHWSVMD